MVYQDLYWNAALIYMAGVIGFWLCVWKITSFLPWRPLRWWITWIYLCVVLTPWQGTDPELYYAPAIIVAAFDFLDVGMAEALPILEPMGAAMVFGTLAIVIAAIVLRIRKMRQPSDVEAAADSETAGSAG